MKEKIKAALFLLAGIIFAGYSIIKRVKAAPPELPPVPPEKTALVIRAYLNGSEISIPSLVSDTPCEEETGAPYTYYPVMFGPEDGPYKGINIPASIEVEPDKKYKILVRSVIYHPELNQYIHYITKRTSIFWSASTIILSRGEVKKINLNFVTGTKIC
jgi:hypothetical protein